MVSAENYVWNGERVVRYRRHVLIYAPYVPHAEIGSTGSDPWMPWVLNEGKSNASVITVVRFEEEGPETKP